MREVKIIGRELHSIEEVHELLYEELELPDYYGANLDALYDVLTEMSEPTRLEMSLSGMEEEDMEKYLEKMWHVLCDAADENLYLEIQRTDDEE